MGRKPKLYTPFVKVESNKRDGYIKFCVFFDLPEDKNFNKMCTYILHKLEEYLEDWTKQRDFWLYEENIVNLENIGLKEENVNNKQNTILNTLIKFFVKDRKLN